MGHYSMANVGLLQTVSSVVPVTGIGAQLSTATTMSPLSAVYQLPPHVNLLTAANYFTQIRAAGFSSVQFPPIHPTGLESFHGKRASAYAPAYLHDVSPVVTGAMSAAEYLGLRAPVADQNGWQTIARIAELAHHAGLEVIGDLVLHHTARDPDITSYYQDRFGVNFYRQSSDGEIVRSGASEDSWDDVAPIDHMGPAKASIMNYFQGLLKSFFDAGIHIFRVDAVPFIPQEFWREFIDGAHQLASRMQRPAPIFLAEILGFPAHRSYEATQVGFDAVSNSGHWMRLNQGFSGTRWALDQINSVSVQGRVSVGFTDNHDTERLAAMTGSVQDFRTKFLVLALLTPGFSLLAGTLAALKDKVGVYLGRNNPNAMLAADFPSQGFASQGEFAAQVLGVKAAYDVFNTPGHAELAIDGTGLLHFSSTASNRGAAHIFVNPDNQGDVLSFPLPPHANHVFFANIGLASDPKPIYGRPDPHFSTGGNYLLPRGAAVFVEPPR